MKKFLQFIWEIIGPVVRFIVGVAAWLIAIAWIFTLFGMLIILAPTSFPTPEWVKYVIVVFDTGCVIGILYNVVRNAYEKVYKH